MQSITHILDSIKLFSSNCFSFLTSVEPLVQLDLLPDDISARISNPAFTAHLKNAVRELDWCSDYFSNLIAQPLKKHIASLKPSSQKDTSIGYADFKVEDLPPVFKNEARPVQLSFRDLSEIKSISPVKRRKDISFMGSCPFCDAPNEYIYDNNGGKGQFRCKSCNHTFSTNHFSPGGVGIYCPHCNHKLSLKHDRSSYKVYMCENKKCSHFLKNKERVKNGDAASLKTSSGQLLLHYHYRDFKFSLASLQRVEEKRGDSSRLSRIHADNHILGLCLTYFVNYGLSARKTALILREVHGIHISHQTVFNYASLVSNIIKDMVDSYKYELCDAQCGDETYIKVRGKNHYVFFWSDPEYKTITSYRIFATRDTQNACQSIYDLLMHFHQPISKDLTLITDANPIYNAAQLFFQLNGINFGLEQVIGVKNLDRNSKLFRPFKQIEERLNRTYKQNYYGTNGYDTLEGANSYMVLFVAFFNFLRRHSALHYRTPVHDPAVDPEALMPDQWIQLIDMSLDYCRA